MDQSTGLTYMQQRYYDPALGRFLSTDPIAANVGSGASFNRYYYANNNPYGFTDPDGRSACPGFSAAICIRADNGPSSGVTAVISDASESKAISAENKKMYRTNDTHEPMGYQTVDSDGNVSSALATDVTRDRNDRGYKATSTKPSNAVAVEHGHPPSGASGGSAQGVTSFGDAQTLHSSTDAAPNGLPNIVHSDGRTGVTEIVDGTLQFRMIEGRMTHDEIRDQQAELDNQQQTF